MLQNMFLWRILLRELWSDRLLVLLGSTKLWTRSPNEYPLDGLSWRRWCNTCRVLFLIAEKNSSSALSHNDENVSKFAGQKPVLLAPFEETIISIPLRCIQKSAPCRGSIHEFCNNHWSEYRLKVDTTHSMRTNCAERIQRAHAPRTSDTWSRMENVRPIVTPSIFTDSTRCIPGIGEGGLKRVLDRGLLNTISTVFDVFNCKVFLTAHVLMFSSSANRLHAFCCNNQIGVIGELW